MSMELITLTHDRFIEDLSDLEEVLVPYRASKKKLKAFFYIGTPQSHVILEVIFDPSYKHEHKAFYLDESKSSDRLGKIKEKYPLAFTRCNLIPSEYFDGTFKAVPEKYRPFCTDDEAWLTQIRIENKRLARNKNIGREAAAVWGTALLIGVGIGIALGIGTAGVGFVAIIIGLAVTVAVMGVYYLIKDQLRKNREKKEKANKTEELPADIEPELTKSISDIVDFMLKNSHRALFFMSPALKGERDFSKELLQNPHLIEKMIMKGDKKLLHAITVSGLLYRPVSHLYSKKEVQAYNIIAAITSIPLLERIKEFNLLGFNPMVENRIKEVQPSYVKIAQATAVVEKEKEDVDFSVEQYAHRYNDIRKVFSEGKFSEAMELFKSLCEDMKVESVDMSSVLINLLKSAGGADRFDYMMAEKFGELEYSSTPALRLKDAVISLIGPTHYHLRDLRDLDTFLKDNTPLCQLFMLEKIFSTYRRINKKNLNEEYVNFLQNKYLEIFTQCKDESLAMKFLVTSQLLQPEGVMSEAKKAALMLLEPKTIADHVLAYPEDCVLFFDKDKGLRDVMIKNPMILKEIMEKGSPELRKIMKVNGIIKEACLHAKDKAVKFMLGMKFEQLIANDRKTPIRAVRSGRPDK